MYKINHANIKEWAKNYDGPLFDGILCDPPYELGFMGKSWDSSGIAFDTEMWTDIYNLLKPGAHLLAFSGSRTYHRMAVAIEDAGFEIRDMIEWVYGSGFPKSRNIGLDVDKRNGITKNRGKAFVVAGQSGQRDKDTGGDLVPGSNTMGAYQAQNDWNGYGTALKPAHEPCVLARKPLEKGHSVAQNALKHGTGGLNIDGSRIATTEDISGISSSIWSADGTAKNVKSDGGELGGRFPANLIHDGSDEVVGLFPETGKSSGGRIGNKGSMINTMGTAYEKGDPGFGDSGSAARFFYNAKPDEEMYSLKYCAKASKSERNAGLDGLPMKAKNERKNGGKSVLEVSGSVAQNHHPTVKPLSLTKYLANLIKPPTGGRLLVPFSGSGSEMIGALQAGWEYVEGVELTEEYIPIAEARIKYWTSLPNMTLKPKPSAKKNEPVQQMAESLTLF